MNYMKMTTLFLAIALAGASQAATYDLAAEYSAGTGANSATIVIDFGTAAYSFTYNWDGAASGWQALQSVDLAGDLAVGATDYGPMGIYVWDLAYPGATTFDYGLTATGWSYFSSDNGEAWYQTMGVAGRGLTDGGWDCWMWSNYDAEWNPLRQPGETATIPEPMTLCLLGLGGIFVRRCSASRV